MNSALGKFALHQAVIHLFTKEVGDKSEVWGNILELSAFLTYKGFAEAWIYHGGLHHLISQLIVLILFNLIEANPDLMNFQANYFESLISEESWKYPLFGWSWLSNCSRNFLKTMGFLRILKMKHPYYLNISKCQTSLAHLNFSENLIGELLYYRALYHILG